MPDKRLRIAVLMDSAVSRFQEKPCLGINRYAAEAGIDAIYFGVGGLNPSSHEDCVKLRFFDMISPLEFDGLIVVSTSLLNSGGAAYLKRRLELLHSLPMVSIGPSVIGEPSFCFDNRRGIRDIMKHLIEDHRYRRFAYVSGPLGNAEARERLEAYRSALDDAGIARSEDEEYYGTFLHSSGIAAVQSLLDERGLRPEVFVCANDMMALGVWNGLIERGKLVPYDFAITGFDDYQLSSALTNQFTTIKQSFEELGYNAAARVHAMIRGDTLPEAAPLPARMIIRGSCGCVGHDSQEEVSSGDPAGDRLGAVREHLTAYLASGDDEDERAVYRIWTEAIRAALAEKRPVHDLEIVLWDCGRIVGSSNDQKRAYSSISRLHSILMEECGQAVFIEQWRGMNQAATIQSAVDRLQDDVAKDLSLTSHDDDFQAIAERCGACALHVVRFSDPSSPLAGAASIYAYDRDDPLDPWSAGPGAWFPARSRSFVANMIGIDDVTWGYLLIDATIPLTSTFDFLRFRFSSISKDLLIMSRIRRLNSEMADEISAHQETERKLKDALALVEQMSVEDELTRLRNRRGFLALAEQQVKYLRRQGQGFFLFYADLDGLKAINDRWGHADGDLAIRCAAEILREALRESDIVARMGGDEFTALIGNANPPNFDVISKRIAAVTERKNAMLAKPWTVSMSLGQFYSSNDCDFSLDRMLELADMDLYTEKQRRKTEIAQEQ